MIKPNTITFYTYGCDCVYVSEIRYDTGWSICGAHSHKTLVRCENDIHIEKFFITRSNGNIIEKSKITGEIFMNIVVDKI